MIGRNDDHRSAATAAAFRIRSVNSFAWSPCELIIIGRMTCPLCAQCSRGIVCFALSPSLLLFFLRYRPAKFGLPFLFKRAHRRRAAAATPPPLLLCAVVEKFYVNKFDAFECTWIRWFFRPAICTCAVPCVEMHLVLLLSIFFRL